MAKSKVCCWQPDALAIPNTTIAIRFIAPSVRGIYVGVVFLVQVSQQACKRCA